MLTSCRVWETVYYSRSEGAIEDNEATFFNISLCGGITGQWQPTQCTGSPTSVCMRSSDNAVFSLADTPSCDVTYDSHKRHVQFIYNYSSSAEATFHKGNVTITLICGQHLVSVFYQVVHAEHGLHNYCTLTGIMSACYG